MSEDSTEPQRRTHAGLLALQAVTLIGVLAWAGAAWAGAATAKRETTPTVSVATVPAPDPLPEPTVAPVPTVASARPASARVDAAWLARVGARTGIPRAALAAYAGASVVLAEEKPQCHLGWNTLAAIGRIESNDGRYNGSTVSDNGYPSLPIRGPALNGGAFAGIPDSDGGVWDGDTVWDRAVGPFQFIPQTWRTWGADGNGDGQADPNQLDDAALAAARYLCNAGDLSSVDGWRRAVLSYNHSESYVDEVATVADSVKAAAGF